jgi:hypothetical protein
MLTALNADETLPFDCPAMAASDALNGVAAGLQQLGKKGQQ